MSVVRTRFAPSPTGYLHIGGLRTALYAYCFAKQNGGTFMLRIEDTDTERYVEGAVEQICDTLKDAGLFYDEGPDVGGKYAPYVQSQRKELYLKTAEQLVKSGAAYYCFCTHQRLEQLKASGATKYDKHCCNLSPQEVQAKIQAGEKYVIRQNIPAHGVSSYEDQVYGTISVDYNDLEDGILLKSDLMPTYNFANVVDDHYMNITHVLRGSEFLSSTPKYNLIYEALGWTPPVYAHMPPIMQDEHHKLSKRSGAASYQDFINKGFLKQAILNYIALLGWSPKENREKFCLQELIDRFSLAGLSKSGAIFDERKMRWLNSVYLKEMDFADYFALAQGWLKKLDYLQGYDLQYLASLLKERIETFEDFAELTKFLTTLQDYDLQLLCHQKLKCDTQTAKQVLPVALQAIEKLANFETEVHDALMGIAPQLGLKNGQVLWPFRIAITGQQNTPGGATEMAILLGKQRVIQNLQHTLKRLQQI